MADKKLGIDNMNGDTTNDDKSCGLTDMNCNGSEESSHSLDNMNGATNDEDKSCGLTDMNCVQ